MTGREDLPPRALQKLLAIAGEDQRAPLPRLPERYRIVGEIGRGGMGVVYEAHDRQLDRLVAVKRIGSAAGADDEARRRFAREALAAARLRHPHIAAIHDATPDYISMQRIVGVPLDAIDRGERRLLVELVRDAALALHHAHEQGIVHRDVKPSNLLVEGRHVFVVDFGLAKAPDVSVSQSLAGAVVGTPAFMAPEQALARSGDIDARSDVYSLGATLHQVLTGRPPFAAADLPTLLRAVVETEPRAPGIERDLDLVILKCLAKEPNRRYASAAALAQDLDRWLRQEPIEARRPSFGYRLKKQLQRRRAFVRTAGIAAALAVGGTALVLVPIALRERAERAAASEAVALSAQATSVLQDAAMFDRLGDLPSAREALDASIARVREYLGRYDVARVHHLLSRLLRATGQLDEAHRELELALTGDPTLVEARFERGLMLASRQPLEPADRLAAIADLESAVAPGAALTNADRLFGQAELHRLRGENEAALGMLEELLAYDPGHVAARVSSSRVALAMGDAALAARYAVSAVDLQAGYGPVYLAREQRGLPTAIYGLDAALVDFGEQLANSPDNELALAHRGLVQLRRALRLEREGQPRAAMQALEAAIEDHDVALRRHAEVFGAGHLSGANNNRAVCAMQAQRLWTAAGDSAAAAAARQRALDDLTAALAASPDLPEAHLNLGILALRTAEQARAFGRPTQASRELAQAIASLQRALACGGDAWPHSRQCRARLGEAERLAGR